MKILSIFVAFLENTNFKISLHKKQIQEIVQEMNKVKVAQGSPVTFIA